MIKGLLLILSILFATPAIAQVDVLVKWGPSATERSVCQSVDPVKYWVYECNDAALLDCERHEAGQKHTFGPLLILYNSEKWFYIRAYRFKCLVVDGEIQVGEDLDISGRTEAVHAEVPEATQAKMVVELIRQPNDPDYLRIKP